MKITISKIVKGQVDISIAKEFYGYHYISDNEFLLLCKRVEGSEEGRVLKRCSKYLNRERYDEDKLITFIKNTRNKCFPKGSHYSPEYVSARNNITIQEAQDEIDKFKKNKATSLKGFIKRYGEEEGHKKFQRFQETSSISTSDDRFKERFGEDWISEKKLAIARRSQFCIEYWIHRGSTSEEAVNLVKERQLMAGSKRKYWESRGLDNDVIDVIMASINSKFGMTRRSRRYAKKFFGDDWEEKYKEYMDQYRLDMEERGVWRPRDTLDGLRQYRLLCSHYTEISLMINTIDDIEKRSHGWHVDHMYSVKQGYLDSTDPKIVGSIVNLRIISKSENSKKHAKSILSKSELLERYKEYENCKNNT